MRRALDWLVMDDGGRAVVVAAMTGLAASRHPGAGSGAGREGDQVPDIEADADPLADAVVMVRGHQRQ